jgi:hypothetical protein
MAWLNQNEQIAPTADDYFEAAIIKVTARKQGSDCLIAGVAIRLSFPLATGNTVFATVAAGSVVVGWTPIPFPNGDLAGKNFTGVTTALAAVINAPAGSYTTRVRVCTTGTACTAGSEAGWGPFSGSATGQGGSGFFTLQ